MEDDTDESSESDIELREAIEFGTEEVEKEIELAEGDVPRHGAELVVSRANDILQSITNVRLKRAVDEVSDEQEAEIIEESVVDLLLALSTLDYEYDLDIATAFEERKEFIESYNAFEDARQEADSQAEVMEAFEEHMEEHADEAMMGQAVPSVDDIGMAVGDNVDDEDYDHDHKDKGYM